MAPDAPIPKTFGRPEDRRPGAAGDGAGQLRGRFPVLTGLFTKTAGRYLAVGAACAILNNSILIVGDRSGLHYTVSVALTFLLVLPISYLAHALWSFSGTISWLAFGRYVAGSLSSLLVAGLTLGVLRGGLSLPMVAAAPILTILMTFYNYGMTRWAIRRGRRLSASPWSEL